MHKGFCTAARIGFAISVMATSGQAELLTTVRLGGAPQAAVTWDITELKKISKQSRTETDLHDHQSAHWRGMPLSEFVEKSIAGLSPENRAQIDLLVFHGSNGEEVTMPRWLASRYPILVATEKGHSELAIPALVLPASSQPKILREALPVESFFLEGVASVEFTSYRLRYGSLYLTVRTDPAALRGEKYFVQNCTGCHSASSTIPNISHLITPESIQNFSKSGHPTVGKDFKVDSNEQRALLSYLRAYRTQQSIDSTHAAN